MFPKVVLLKTQAMQNVQNITTYISRTFVVKCLKYYNDCRRKYTHQRTLRNTSLSGQILTKFATSHSGEEPAILTEVLASGTSRDNSLI
jgi:hypothetical protein